MKTLVCRLLGHRWESRYEPMSEEAGAKFGSMARWLKPGEVRRMHHIMTYDGRVCQRCGLDQAGRNASRQRESSKRQDSKE